MSTLWWVLSALGLVVIAVLVYQLIRIRRLSADDREIEKAIKEECEDVMKDVIISDGMYGYHFIDYLVLLRNKILALNVQHYHGYIFGSDKVEQWAQVNNNRSHNFDNPLHQNDMYIQRLLILLDEKERNDIVGHVVFSSESQFPKGVPQGVSEFKNFKEDLRRLSGNGSIQESLKELWNQLSDIARQHKSRYVQESG